MKLFFDLRRAGAEIMTAALILLCWSVSGASAAAGQTGAVKANKPANPIAGSVSSAHGSSSGAKLRTAKTHRKRRAAAKPATQTAAAAPAEPTPPPAPPAPAWPVNDKPAAASVRWDGRDLSIAATNSSLAQILTDVSTAIGVKVEGESGDQRVYGKYGPAPARDVLNELLEGSGYNIVMVGDSGQGTPRELLLSLKTRAARSGGGGNAQSGQGGEDDAVEEPEPQPQPQEPVEPARRRPFGMTQQPPGQQRNDETPQEQQQRLQQLQQQLQQQPQPPQPVPNPQPPQDNE